jgi:hypothetical protein
MRHGASRLDACAGHVARATRRLRGGAGRSIRCVASTSSMVRPSRSRAPHRCARVTAERLVGARRMNACAGLATGRCKFVRTRGRSVAQRSESAIGRCKSAMRRCTWPVGWRRSARATSRVTCTAGAAALRVGAGEPCRRTGPAPRWCGAPAPLERVACSSSQVACSGDRVGYSGNQVAQSGDQVDCSGDRVGCAGDQAG